MNRSIRLLLSPFLEVSSDLKSFGPGFCTFAEQIPTSTPTNGFSVIQVRNLRKRTQSYVILERQSKRSRTSYIWLHEKEVILKDESDIQRWWECDLCQERFVVIITTNVTDHLRRKYNIKINNESFILLSLFIIKQQRRFVKTQ